MPSSVPFADEARHALEASRRLSHDADFDMIRPASMLLGMLDVPTARATIELRREGVNVQELAAAIRAMSFKRGLSGGGPDLAYCRAAKEVLDEAMRHAQRKKKQVVTTLDLLVGIASVASDPASRLLRSVGIDWLQAERLSARHTRDNAS